MKKSVLTGLSLGTAVALALVGAGSYTHSRVSAEIEAAFDAMRANGLDASHGPVAINLFSRSTVIADVALKHKDTEVQIGNVAVAGFDLFSSVFAANRVEFSKLIAKTSAAGVPASTHRIIVSVPTLVATGVRANPETEPPLASADNLQQAMQAIARLSAGSVTVPTYKLDQTISIPPPPASALQKPQPTTFELAATYENTRLENISEGRIARASVDGVTMSGKGPVELTAKIGRMQATDIDLAPLSGVVPANRQKRDGYYTVQGKNSIEGMQMNLPNGAEFSIGSFSSSRMDIDPDKFSYPRLMAMSDAMAKLPPQPTPQQTQAMMNSLLGIYEGMRFEGIEVRDLRLKHGQPTRDGGDISIGAIAMNRFARGKLDEFRIENLDVSVVNPAPAKAGPAKLGRFSLRGLDMVRLMRVGMILSAQPPGRQPPPQAVLGMLSGLAGVEVVDLDMVHPQTGQQIRVEQFKFAWDQFINDIPTRIETKFKGSVPFPPTKDPYLAMLRQQNIREASFSYGLSIGWDEPTRMIRAEGGTDINLLGSVRTKWALGNVPRDIFSINPQALLQALPAIELGEFEYGVTDRGAMKLLRDATGGNPLDDIVAQLKQAWTDPSRPEAAVARVLDGATRFLATPGQTFTVKIASKGRVAIGQFLPAQGKPAPDQWLAALDAFTTEVTVAP